MNIAMKRNIHSTKNILEVKKIKAGDIIEQDTINYVSESSLESIAILNVAVTLCKQPDIRDAIWQQSLNFASVKDVPCTYLVLNESVTQIEENVFNKLSNLPLPNLLKDKVANIVRPIVLQILKWICSCWNDIEYMDSICWTTEGAIDRVRTLKQLAEKDTGKHIYIIYKLACIYCIEDIIPDLWNKLPKRVQKYYLNGKNMYQTYDDYLIAYWSSFLNKELLSETTLYYLGNGNHGFYNKMFTSALIMGNSLAVKHFWNKLTAAEMNNNLALWIKYACSRTHTYNGVISNDSQNILNLIVSKINGEKQRREVLQFWKNYKILQQQTIYSQCGNYTCSRTHCYKYQDTNDFADILHFLLSKINDKEQQREVLRQNCNLILMSFVYFPWQKFLLPTMQTTWEFIDEEVYAQFLLTILKEIRENKTADNFFLTLWYGSPVNLQKSFIQRMFNNSECADVVCNLLTNDVGTIKVILNYADIEDKKQIANNLVLSSKLFKVIYNSKFIVADIYIEVLSEIGISNVKEKIVHKNGSDLCLRWILANNWKMVEIFFSWAFSSPEQSGYFKNKVLKKKKIAYSLVLEDNYESLNEFIDWCFPSEQEVKQFKLDILQFCQENIFHEIVYRHSFEFVDKLISWCCQFSEESINHYKSEFVLSDSWICILKTFFGNEYNCASIDWESIRKLISLYSPLAEDVVIKLKEKIKADIHFYFYENSCRLKTDTFKTPMIHLFHLIHCNNKSYNESSDKNSNVYDCVAVDDDFYIF